MHSIGSSGPHTDFSNEFHESASLVSLCFTRQQAVDSIVDFEVLKGKATMHTPNTSSESAEVAQPP